MRAYEDAAAAPAAAVGSQRHYHPWLLHQLPPAPQDVLDVGCGAGGLAAKLAARAAYVDAVDVSAPMIARARARHATTGNIRWLVGDLLHPALPVKHEGYDVVTALSSVHHMPLQPVLGRLAGLVRPGGVLAVIGFYRQATLSDRGIEALPANAAVGVVLASRGSTDGADIPLPSGARGVGTRSDRGYFSWDGWTGWRRMVLSLAGSVRRGSPR